MYPELLERVKILLGLEWEIEQDDILNEFINNFAQMVKLYMQTDILPTELEFVVIESTIERYRRIGSEGFESESMGEVSVTYQEILSSYYRYMDYYKNLYSKNRFL